jgi:hypothetical protein
MEQFTDKVNRDITSPTPMFLKHAVSHRDSLPFPANEVCQVLLPL